MRKIIERVRYNDACRSVHVTFCIVLVKVPIM